MWGEEDRRQGPKGKLIVCEGREKEEKRGWTERWGEKRGREGREGERREGASYSKLKVS